MNVIENSAVFEKECNTTKRKFVTWEFIEEFAHRRIWPFDDGIISGLIGLAINIAMNMVAILIVGFVTWSFTDYLGFWYFWGGLLLHFVTFYTIYKIAENRSLFHRKHLNELQNELNGALYSHYQKKCAEENIQNGCIWYDNDVVVSVMDSSVCIPVGRNFGDIQIYRILSNVDTVSDNSRYVSLNRDITSVEFNRSLCAITPRENERLGFTYFSPSVQVGLINLYKKTNFPVGTLLLSTMEDKLVLMVDRQHTMTEFESVNLFVISKLRIFERICKIDREIKAAAAEARTISRRFDTDLRALRKIA